VIYLDTSVALAHLLAEDRTPPEALWNGTLVSSRLLEYELFVRLNALGLATTHGDIARALIDRVSLLELSALVLGRVLEAFPRPVRTLDAFHLASMEFLRGRGRPITLASYDGRLTDAATRLGIPLFDLGQPDSE
jgi:predicted nucleic acid-binding protein